MGDHDLKLLRRQCDAIANVLFAFGGVAATIIVGVMILQQGWPWWQSGFALCGIVFAWATLFAWVAKVDQIV